MCQLWDNELSPNGRVQDHMIHCLNFGPNHIFEIGEARHFKCCLLIDTEEC